MAYKMPIEFRKNILVLHNNPLDENSQILFLKKGLQEYGHKVHTIWDEVNYPVHLNNPNNQYAVFVKTFLLLCSALWYSWFNSPDIIFTECHYALLPLLRMFTRAKIVQLCYSMIKTQKKCFTRKPPPNFEMQCLPWADDIIVPNRIAARLVKTNYKLSKLPHVLFPCVDIPVRPFRFNNPKLRDFYRNNTINYLCVTDMEPSSELIKLVQAMYAIHDRHRHVFTIKPNLVIIGQNYDSSSQAVKKHLERINIFISCFNLEKHIVIHYDDDQSLIHSLIRRCNYFINITPDQFFNQYFMVAMKFGKPIVSLRSGFAIEFIKNGFNGFLVQNNPESYAIAISCLTVVPAVYNKTRFIQLFEYRCSYENRKFAIKFNEFVVGITNGVKVVILDDALKRVYWRSAMHIVRYGLACFYVTGYGNLINLYRYYGRDYFYYTIYYYLNGETSSKVKQISQIIDSIKHIDLQTIYIELEWRKATVEMGDVTGEFNMEEEAIDEHLKKVVTVMQRLDDIYKGNYGTLLIMKEYIGYCAVKIN